MTNLPAALIGKPGPESAQPPGSISSPFKSAGEHDSDLGDKSALPQEEEDATIARALYMQEAEQFRQDEQIAITQQSQELYRNLGLRVADCVQTREELALEISARQVAQRQLQELYEYNRIRYWDPLWGEVVFEYLPPNASCCTAMHYGSALHCYSGFACWAINLGCFKRFIHHGPSPADLWKSRRRFMLSCSMALGVLQVSGFFVAVILNGGFAPLKDNWMIGPDLSEFNRMGAKNAARILDHAEWWRLLSPLGLHGGLFHLISNLMIQLQVGVVLEVVWGWKLWLMFYLLSGMYGSLASCIWLPNSLSIGSSGALCGLIGAWLSFIAITWHQTLPKDIEARRAERNTVVIAAISIVALSFVPMVDMGAHIGGLLFGCLLSMAVFARMLQNWTWRLATFTLGCAALVGLVSGSLVWFLSITEVDEDLLQT